MALGLAVLVYLTRSGAIDWVRLGGLLAVWPVTLLAVALLGVAMVLTSWRLTVLFRAVRADLPLGASVRLTMVGTFFNLFLPGFVGGDAARLYYATADQPGRRTELATVIVLDRVCGMFALMLWPVLAALATPALIAGSTVLLWLVGAAAVVALGTAVGMLVALSPVVAESRWLDRGLGAIPLGAHLRRGLGALQAYRGARGALLSAVGLSVASHTLVIGVILLLAEAVVPTGAALEMLVLTPLGFVANLIPLTPGGLGVGEAAFEQLFAMAGFAGGAEVMLGWRMAMLGLGLVGLGFYLQGRRDYVAPPQAAPVEPVPSGAAAGADTR